MSKLVNGILVSERIIQKIFIDLEKGRLIKINAVIVQQTGAATAKHTFNSYEAGGSGAHFIIDKAGVIYQTAHLTKKTHHIGKIKSKCFESGHCSKNELKKATDILYEKGKSYPSRILNLHQSEKEKTYPTRYPTNDDSVGIEIVGSFNKAKKEYEAVSKVQNGSLKWLVGQLHCHYGLTNLDVYRHPEVSYKKASEASSATW